MLQQSSKSDYMYVESNVTTLPENYCMFVQSRDSKSISSSGDGSSNGPF